MPKLTPPTNTLSVRYTLIEVSNDGGNYSTGLKLNIADPTCQTLVGGTYVIKVTTLV